MPAPARGRNDKTTSTYLTSGAVTAWRAGRLINLSGQIAVRQCTVAGEEVDGFFLFDQADGDYVTLASQGYHRVEAGAAIVAGAQLMTGTDGRMLTYVAGAGVSIAGIAEMAASGAGVFIIVRHGNLASAAA